MKKSLAIILLAVIIVTSFNTSASANGNELDSDIIISPMFTYIHLAEAQMYIDTNGKATVTTEILGYSNVTSTKATVRLQQLRDDGAWITIRTWNENSSSRSLYFSGTYNVPKGYYYRVRSLVTAYSGSQSESTTLTTSYQKY